ncbi:Aminotransferase, DegT/DnrJ/EryC1/StrS family [hydrothermal vent metagenome]|uniref:Aminotransferase, DegT/DnrJ/EryC1/StrS family n=1 Tax=hydrothermal vent metagenome TaxID=652676 RepID=A0A3B0ZJU4_9ZZZZ
MIPYAKQSIDESDIEAVCEVLRSDFLTTGPTIELFENVLSRRVGMPHAVALNSGTAALHAALVAIGIGPGDEVIVPPITFVATANAVIYCGATPVFSDVDPDTLLLDPQQVEQNITTATRAIIAVDYAGQPADYPALRAIADCHGLILIADACHSLGAELNGTPVGALADLTIFSFHPVKPITAGEGGMVITHNPQYAERMVRFRSHGIDKDHNLRAALNSWEYDMTELGHTQPGG